MRVIETALDEDLSLFSGYLWQRGIRHRIFEERGQQVLEIADEAQCDAVLGAYRSWRSGDLEILAAASGEPTGLKRFVLSVARYPALATLVLLALLAFPFTWPLADGRLTPIASWLTVIDFGGVTHAPTFMQLLMDFQPWRWVTPIFVHYGIVHLAFNCAVVVELGRRVEFGVRSRGFLILVLVLAVVSNLGQYAVSPNPNFGGLSGVAYGLLGYVLARNRLLPEEKCWQLPAGLAGSLLFFLVLFTTGITEAFGLNIANGAHWGGLFAGAICALFYKTTAGSAQEPRDVEGPS
ncbi:MAG: rhomboid family intramembrane serine protease [Gammaproteobacteria bacterium]|nr:rhomboid family intramembrane serine protease [Gammaproteobacteria bacterium]